MAGFEFCNRDTQAGAALCTMHLIHFHRFRSGCVQGCDRLKRYPFRNALTNVTRTKQVDPSKMIHSRGVSQRLDATLEYQSLSYDLGAEKRAATSLRIKWFSTI